MAAEAAQNYQDFADYLALIAGKPQDKLALVDDDCSYCLLYTSPSPRDA